MRKQVQIGVAALTLLFIACAGEDTSGETTSPDDTNTSDDTDGEGVEPAATTTPDGLVVSHLEDGNDCAEWAGKAQIQTFSPSVLGPCPPRTAVACAKCEDQYPIVTFAVDGIRYRNEYYARPSEAACVDWAEGSRRADECEIEWGGKFTPLAPGVQGPSNLTIPEVTPGTPTEGIGPWHFSLLDFEVEDGAVKFAGCTNYYGDGVTEDMRWRGDDIPCPDEGRIRTAPSPFVLENVTAEYVYYEE